MSYSFGGTTAKESEQIIMYHSPHLPSKKESAHVAGQGHVHNHVNGHVSVTSILISPSSLLPPHPKEKMVSTVMYSCSL